MPDNNNFLEQLKKIKISKIIYPLIISVFLIIIAWIFISSISFLSKNIDKAFSLFTANNITGLIKIDLENYSLLAEKLEIPLNIEKTADFQELPIPEVQPNIEAENLIASTTVPLIEEKQFKEKDILKIEILNSTRISGLASELKGLLAASDFLIENIGNQTNTEKATLIKIKQEEMDSLLIKELGEIVSKKYPSMITQSLENSSAFDVIIVIGEK